MKRSRDDDGTRFDGQAWLEVVSSTDETAIVIEDGAIDEEEMDRRRKETRSPFSNFHNNLLLTIDNPTVTGIEHSHAMG